jgi:hypothetical protein
MIKLLPCSYADSEAILTWLNSFDGYQVQSLNNILVNMIPTNTKRYYVSINSVTEQYLFSNNNACSKDHIKYKMKKRGFRYIGKCGSYLFFDTESKELIKSFDSIDRTTEANTLAIRIQVLVIVVSMFLTIETERLWIKRSFSNILFKNIGIGCILFPIIYTFLELFELIKRKKDPTKKPNVESFIPETIKRILLIAMIIYIIFYELL